MKSIRLHTGFIVLYIMLCQNILVSQNYKEDALREFDLQRYPQAIELMTKALAKDSTDAEIYFYLGKFYHFLAYDSKPIDNYNLINHSDKVLSYLEKAIKIKSDYGDALYFIAAEHGARIKDAIRQKDIAKVIEELKAAKEKGGFPNWLLEYVKNTLKLCDKNAILFLNGDAYVNTAQYLQLIEEFRKDITVVTVAYLDRPWYIEYMKNGFDGYFADFPVGWTEDQIMDMHPYKWDTASVSIPICKEIVKEFNLKTESVSLTIAPDMHSNTMSCLSNRYAVLINVLINNQFKRPICFLPYMVTREFPDLEEYVENAGLVSKLMPFKTNGTEFSISPARIEEVLCNKENLVNVIDVKTHPMPRIDNMLQNYYAPYITLLDFYILNNDIKKARVILKTMDKVLPSSLISNNENLENIINTYREKIMIKK